MNPNLDPRGDMLALWQQRYIADCNVCMRDENGNPKVNHGQRSGYGIPSTDEDEHITTTRHVNYLHRGRGQLPHIAAHARAPGCVFDVRVPVGEVTFRCRVCSLTPQGIPRHTYGAITASSAVAHVTSPDHQRRADRQIDPRYQLFLQRGLPWVAPALP